MYLNYKIINGISLLIFTLVLSVVVGASIKVHAQSFGSAIATTYAVLGGNPQAGDIISLDKSTHTFHLSHIPGDKDAYGVIVKNPILLLSDSNPNDFPVITSGEVSVNVTTQNGPIKAGDYISPSSIPGKGVRATISDPYIIGTAISSLVEASSSPVQKTKQIYAGSIQMIFYRRINPLVAVVQQTPQSIKIGKSIIFHIIKYILAALVAIGTVYVAFKVSASNMENGIISIGRNPLAKASIRSMLIINIIMILFISSIGLAAALAIVFLPV